MLCFAWVFCCLLTTAWGCVVDPYDPTIRGRCNQPYPDCPKLHGPDSVMDCNLLCCNGTSDRECWAMSPCGWCMPRNSSHWNRGMDCTGACLGMHIPTKDGGCVLPSSAKEACEILAGPDAKIDCRGVCCGGKNNRDRVCWALDGCGSCRPTDSPHFWTAADGCRPCFGEPTVLKDGYCVSAVTQARRQWAFVWTVAICRHLDKYRLSWVLPETCAYVRKHEPWHSPWLGS